MTDAACLRKVLTNSLRDAYDRIPIKIIDT